MTSPSLLFHRDAVDARWGISQLARHPGIAAKLDGDDSVLARAIRRMSSRRIGEYFETLLRVWLESVGEATVVASNLQVNSGSGTVGEFDLLFRRDRRVHHWELAVKFYLGYPGPSGPIWYGPDPVDQLHVKWKRMRKKQLRLSEHPVGRDALERLGIRERVDAAAYVKGYLYDAVDPDLRTHDHPHANRDAPRGWWLHRGAISRHPDEMDRVECWARLPPDRWLAGVDSIDDVVHGTLEALVDSYPSDRAQHVVGMSKRNGRWRETSRGFIVPDEWPNTPD